MVQGENTYKYKDSWNSSGNMPIKGMWTGETSFSKVSTGSSFLTVTSVTGMIEDQCPPFLRRRCCGCARHVNTYRCSHCMHNTCLRCAVELPTPNGVDYPVCVHCAVIDIDMENFQFLFRSMRLPLGIRISFLCLCPQAFQIDKVASSQQRSCQDKQLPENNSLQHSSFASQGPSSLIRSCRSTVSSSFLRSRVKMPRLSGTSMPPWNEGLQHGKNNLLSTTA
eukprot:1256225-Amphidinium_carterae.4